MFSYLVTNEKRCHMNLCPVKKFSFCFIWIVCVNFSQKLEIIQSKVHENFLEKKKKI